MKSKFDYFLVAACAVVIPFVAGGRVKVFGKGIEYDTDILPFLKGVLQAATSVEFSLPIILVAIGGYLLFTNYLYKRLATHRRQKRWYKIHRLLNYLLLIAPILLLEGTQTIVTADQRYSQRFLPILDDLYGQKYYLLFRLDELEGCVFYYTVIVNIVLLTMVIYYAFKEPPNDINKEVILDNLK
ncbi:hypothetical protein [Lewinella cohaerens]|uniref:hypothetical protein n=1 Tax=Lewinella cohaerens TaxID=70995 RepID=UPI00037CBEC8|nr:hypothetical protein [Lewinella cohaerens]